MILRNIPEEIMTPHPIRRRSRYKGTDRFSKVSISLPREILEYAKKAATADHRSMSGWLAITIQRQRNGHSVPASGG